MPSARPLHRTQGAEHPAGPGPALKISCGLPMDRGTHSFSDLEAPMLLPGFESCVPRRTVLFLLLTTLSLLRPGLLVAGQTAEGQNALLAQPRDRITAVIDDERRTVLRGNRHPLAMAANDIGMVSGDFRMERIILTLKPDAARQAALERLVAAQHDAASPNYHQWLTPEEYGLSFGASESDLQQIVNWLRTH